MGFDKLVIGVVTNTIKSTAKFNIAVDGITEKFKDGCPPKEELLKIISQKNSIINALTQVQGLLNNLDKTAGTIDIVLNGLTIAKNVIKFIPIPTGPVPIPVSLITTFADTLDLLGDKIKEGKSITGSVGDAIKLVIDSIQQIIDKLNALDVLVTGCVEELNLTSDDIGESLKPSSILGQEDQENAAQTEENLLNQLQPGSTDPLLYKLFKLEIQYDPKNEFSFPSRRIKATQQYFDPTRKDQAILYNLPQGAYSYSSSVQVLIDEAKFVIDNYRRNNKITLEDLARLNIKVPPQTPRDPLRGGPKQQKEIKK